METANEKYLNLSGERLWKLCQEGIPESHPRRFYYYAEKTLKREFRLVCELGQEDEFLAAAEIQQFARSQGIPCRLILAGCGSIMAQLLGLTEVNPIFLHLCCKRFRDPQERWTPKFHFEVPPEQQQSIVDFVSERYGKEYIANKFCFVEMPILAQVPYRVAELIRKERRSDFTLQTIWREMSFQPDKRVFERLSAGNTEGIFLLEGMERRLLQRLAPTSIEGLTDFLTLSVLVINHPEVVDAYVNRDEDRGISGKLSKNISLAHSATKGLILYDEQIMLLFYLIHYKWLTDGFDFIKAVRNNRSDDVAEYRNRFLNKAVQNGKLDKENALRLFRHIEEATAYACCKAAKAADAMTIYQAGYLKYHYPDLFQRVLQDIHGGRNGENYG